MRTIVLSLFLLSAADAQGLLFDQFGNASDGSAHLLWTQQQDPGPGGLPDALTYFLPFTAFQGDLILTDPNFGDSPLQIIRFNGDGTLIFYAGNLPDSLAFVPNPPSELYSNIAIVSDYGPPSPDFADYTPSDGQPGYDASNPTYRFLNTEVPEPGTGWMCAAFALALGVVARRGRSAGAPIPQNMPVDCLTAKT